MSAFPFLVHKFFESCQMYIFEVHTFPEYIDSCSVSALGFQVTAMLMFSYFQKSLLVWSRLLLSQSFRNKNGLKIRSLFNNIAFVSVCVGSNNSTVFSICLCAYFLQKIWAETPQSPQYYWQHSSSPLGPPSVYFASLIGVENVFVQGKCWWWSKESQWRGFFCIASA